MHKIHSNYYQSTFNLKWYWLSSFLYSVICGSVNSRVINIWQILNIFLFSFGILKIRTTSQCKKSLPSIPPFFLAVFPSSYFSSASWFKLLKKWVLGSQLAESWPFVLAFSPVLPPRACSVSWDDGLFVWYGSLKQGANKAFFFWSFRFNFEQKLMKIQ